MDNRFPPINDLLNGETLTIEYKRDLDVKNKRGSHSIDSLAQSLMALGNAEGGFLLLGVGNSGKLLGIHPQRDTLDKLRIEIIRKFVSPPQITAHPYKVSDVIIWSFLIEPATQTPFQLSDGTFRIRRWDKKKQGPENLPFLFEEILTWKAERGTHHDFSSAIAHGLVWDIHDQWLNPQAIERLEDRIKSGRVNHAALTGLTSLEARFDALNLLVTTNGEKVATNAALILFGRNEILRERLPAHDAQFQKFDASGSLPLSLFLGQEGLGQRCLFLLAERLNELFRGNVARREIMDGLFRIDVPNYGDDALREATMNAFIHRDYSINESVVIQMHPQLLTITNPGGFFRDVTANNILFHEPCPRNKLLAQACADLGLVEKSGRGVDRIFLDQIRYFRPLPSYASSSDTAVRLSIEGGAASMEAVSWMFKHFQHVNNMLVQLVHGAFIHHLFQNGETTRQELIDVLPGLPKDQALRAITELIETGLLTRIGHGRGQRLVLSPQIQREMGRPEAFVHQAGMDEERQQQMILAYVDKHERITRGEAARLLQVPPDIKLSRLLGNLVEKKKLEPFGERRTRHYKKPSASS